MDIEATDETDWDQKLPSALSAIRTVVNKTTNETPFCVAFGFEALKPTDIARSEIIAAAPDSIKEWTNRLDYLKNFHARVRSRILQQHGERKTTRE